MPGTQPTVDTAIWRAEMPSPGAGRCSSSIAPKTAGRFCIGSPIPMNTTFDRRAPWLSASHAAMSACSTISQMFRSRPKPIAPVEQNWHPSAQPT